MLKEDDKPSIEFASPEFVLHTRVTRVALAAAPSAPADSHLNNSSISFWLDEASTPKKLKFKVKLRDGSLRTASIDLA